MTSSNPGGQSSKAASTSPGGQSSKAASTSCAFDNKTFYVVPSMTETSKPEPESQNTANNQATNASGIVVWSPIKHRAEVRNLEHGTGQKMTAPRRIAKTETEAMKTDQSRREQTRDNGPICDWNASLRASMSKVTLQKCELNTYSVRITDDPAPSQSEFEGHNFRRLLEKELEALDYGFSQLGKKAEVKKPKQRTRRTQRPRRAEMKKEPEIYDDTY
jgi:hypothetical protein